MYVEEKKSPRAYDTHPENINPLNLLVLQKKETPYKSAHAGSPRKHEISQFLYSFYTSLLMNYRLAAKGVNKI